MIVTIFPSRINPDHERHYTTRAATGGGDAGAAANHARPRLVQEFRSTRPRARFHHRIRIRGNARGVAQPSRAPRRAETRPREILCGIRNPGLIVDAGIRIVFVRCGVAVPRRYSIDAAMCRIDCRRNQPNNRIARPELKMGMDDGSSTDCIPENPTKSIVPSPIDGSKFSPNVLKKGFPASKS